MNGLPKLKYVKDQLCSSCEMSKAKRSSFKTKAVPSSKGRLNLLHMDLCGPMRVASINGKKYILQIKPRSSWQRRLIAADQASVFMAKTFDRSRSSLGLHGKDVLKSYHIKPRLSSAKDVDRSRSSLLVFIAQTIDRHQKVNGISSSVFMVMMSDHNSNDKWRLLKITLQAPFLNVQKTFEQRSSSLVLHQMTSDHNRSELRIHDHSNEQSSSKACSKSVP
ncbi:hypothetical protein Tco_1474841 [Tanacetum coccineum]